MEQSVSALFTRLHDRVSRDEAALNASARIVFQELSTAFGQIGSNESFITTKSLSKTTNQQLVADGDSSINTKTDEPKKILLESYV